MSVPRPVQFPDYTNAQINAALLADKLNEVIAYLERKEDPIPAVSAAEALAKIGAKVSAPAKPALKPGVTTDGNGHYKLRGRLIKKAEAYA